LNRHVARLRVTGALDWSYAAGPDELEGVLGPVVSAAAGLLTSEQARSRVRSCGAPDCPFLFYDASRNRSRRWCDMAQCGNRMKARRHHARRRAARAGESLGDAR
jgi:predicted RNA-binding Zn ribbon-like protein